MANVRAKVGAIQMNRLGEENQKLLGVEGSWKNMKIHL
jgi:hypothetical protein